MKVYKYCRPEHNPFNGCKTIMLGNNRTFRENYRGEGDFINDAYEGMSNGRDKNGNVFGDTKLNPDGMIFCTCTELLDWPIVHEFFDKNYTSRYCIKNIEDFSTYFLNEMGKQLQHPYLYKEVIYGHIKPTIQNLGITIEAYFDGMRIEPFQSIVEYKEPKDVQIEKIFDTVEHLKASNFNKLPIYSNQHEYRVLAVFQNVIDRVFFNSALKYFLVDVPDIMDYVEEC